MQKVVSILIISVSIVALAQNPLIKKNKSDFPQALLTDDFGILTVEDLMISDCWGAPADYKNKLNSSASPYPAWQCFEAKNLNIICSGNSYDSSEKSRYSLLVIKAKLNGVSNEYLGRKPWSLEGCAATRDEMKRLMKNEKYACVSGSGLDVSSVGTHFWVFDRFKTSRGCESYFADTCSLAYFKQDDCQRRY